MYPWLNYKIFSGPKKNRWVFVKARILEVGDIWWKSLKAWAKFGSCRHPGEEWFLCFFSSGKEFVSLFFLNKNIHPQLKLFFTVPKVGRGKTHCWNPVFSDIYVCNDGGGEGVRKGTCPQFFGWRLSPKIHLSHEKNPRILSIESWLVNRDPYNGLL